MAVSEKRRCTVTPAFPTWNGLLPLSEFDQTLAFVPTLYFYRPSQDWLAHPDRIFATLRDSLSLALVHFHTFSGRLSWAAHNRLEIHCNASGARLIEAESETLLDDYGDFSPSSLFAQLVPYVDLATPLHDLPLLQVQLTHFRCGGVSLGIAMSHAVCDGFSGFKFIGQWAGLARGEKIGTAPFLDRAVLRAAEPPTGPPKFNHTQFQQGPLLAGESDAETQRGRKTTMIVLELSQTQVEELKSAANEGRDLTIPMGCRRACSRYEAVAAHVWRCMCKARGHKSDQETRIGVCVDFRRRVRPPLPTGYFGNAAINVAATEKAGELVIKPLSYAAGKIREAVDSVTDEYVWSAVNYMKSLPDLSRFQDLDTDEESGRKRPFHGNPNLRVTSWLTLPAYDKDFGWGKEVHMGLATHDVDGDTMILASQLGDGSVVVVCCLQVGHADAFKKVFYEDIKYKTLVGHNPNNN